MGKCETTNSCYRLELTAAIMDEPPPEPIKVYENTYIMKPKEGERFSHSKVKAIIAEVLEDKLSVVNAKDKKGRLTWSYDHDDVGDMAKEISNEILAKVKETNCPRYKIICQVSIGENNGQYVRASSRCLWDVPSIQPGMAAETEQDFNDNCASATWANNKIFCVAMCFGLYYD